jgi:hypothetical protein
MRRMRGLNGNRKTARLSASDTARTSVTIQRCTPSIYLPVSNT